MIKIKNWNQLSYPINNMVLNNHDENKINIDYKPT